MDKNSDRNCNEVIPFKPDAEADFAQHEAAFGKTRDGMRGPNPYAHPSVVTEDNTLFGSLTPTGQRIFIIGVMTFIVALGAMFAVIIRSLL